MLGLKKKKILLQCAAGRFRIFTSSGDPCCIIVNARLPARLGAPASTRVFIRLLQPTRKKIKIHAHKYPPRWAANVLAPCHLAGVDNLKLLSVSLQAHLGLPCPCREQNQDASPEVCPLPAARVARLSAQGCLFFFLFSIWAHL